MSIAYVSTVIGASVEDVWSVLHDFHSTTFAEWYGEFDCDAALAGELTGQFTRIYAAFLDELRHHVARAAA